MSERKFEKTRWLEVTEHEFVVFPPEAYGPPPALGDFNDWNKGTMRLTRNCAAFAYDLREPDLADLPLGEYRITIANPGFMSGNPMKAITPVALRDALVSDGYIYLPGAKEHAITPPDGHHLIGAYSFSHPLVGSNLHLYRRSEKDRLWYHKPGWDDFVTNTDTHNEIITDLGKAKRSPFYEFAGLLLRPEGAAELSIQVEPLPPGSLGKIMWPRPGL
ncbi:MAG: hypothetical protein M3N08_09605 [Pseudomonadota bacterium]|nr:hypothetical protein [Pseudomonadota bacterium]